MRSSREAVATAAIPRVLMRLSGMDSHRLQ